MDNLVVKIVKLEPMKVVSFQVISETPERDAWIMLRNWAKPKGLLSDIEKHPVFGFNNPEPEKDQKEYGYEFWIKVDSDFTLLEDVNVVNFEGGLYAVTTCKLIDDLPSDFNNKEGYLKTWHKIFDWVKASKYKFGRHRWLEKPHNPGVPDEELVLDLYCPVLE